MIIIHTTQHGQDTDNSPRVHKRQRAKHCYNNDIKRFIYAKPSFYVDGPLAGRLQWHACWYRLLAKHCLHTCTRLRSCLQRDHKDVLCTANEYDTPRSTLQGSSLFCYSGRRRLRVSYSRYASQYTLITNREYVRSKVTRRCMSTIPFFETRQEYEEVLFLIAEIIP